MSVEIRHYSDLTSEDRLLPHTAKKRRATPISTNAVTPPTTGPATQARDPEPGLGAAAGVVVAAAGRVESSHRERSR